MKTTECIIIIQILSVTAAGFPRRGGGWALTYCLAKFFAENCMKMKESHCAPGSANALHTGFFTLVPGYFTQNIAQLKYYSTEFAPAIK